MIELELNIEVKKKTFKQQEVSARVMRECIKFYEKAEKEEMSDLEAVDAMIVIVAGAFQDPDVTFDSILDGLSAKDLAPVLQRVFEQINDLGSDEKKSAGKKKK